MNLEDRMALRRWHVSEAQRLRALGYTGVEIAAIFNVANSTASAWLNDPDGSKLKRRKDSYHGTCVGCGKRTNGHDGPGRAPSLCVRCTGAAIRTTGERIRWTEEKIIAAIQEWVRLHGDIPKMTDWSRDPEARADPRWPTHTTVIRGFGTWNNAMRAAGYAPRWALNPNIAKGRQTDA